MDNSLLNILLFNQYYIGYLSKNYKDILIK